AAVRDAFAPRLTPLRRRVEAAEAQIATLEAEEKALSAQIAAAAPGTDFAALGSRLRSVQFSLGKTSLEWEEAAQALEEVEKARDAQLAAIGD
ncbi:MAG: hypothetical protein IJP66_08365, partial [Kiritimatiellae bacterium]|nr:hypothetical protein [Kiritimatiellia bacterium]